MEGTTSGLSIQGASDRGGRHEVSVSVVCVRGLGYQSFGSLVNDTGSFGEIDLLDISELDGQICACNDNLVSVSIESEGSHFSGVCLVDEITINISADSGVTIDCYIKLRVGNVGSEHLEGDGLIENVVMSVVNHGRDLFGLASHSEEDIVIVSDFKLKLAWVAIVSNERDNEFSSVFVVNMPVGISDLDSINKVIAALHDSVLNTALVGFVREGLRILDFAIPISALDSHVTGVRSQRSVLFVGDGLYHFNIVAYSLDDSSTLAVNHPPHDDFVLVGDGSIEEGFGLVDVNTIGIVHSSVDIDG
mmetsp:Transcript_20897/g.32318  ORF Transcript_20897/g.32318 Transcript_20897/m.32318 type:complete len:305 (+) Transcript_20897:604-1518(+)